MKINISRELVEHLQAEATVNFVKKNWYDMKGNTKNRYIKILKSQEPVRFTDTFGVSSCAGQNVTKRRHGICEERKVSLSATTHHNHIVYLISPFRLSDVTAEAERAFLIMDNLGHHLNKYSEDYQYIGERNPACRPHIEHLSFYCSQRQ